MPLSPDLSLKVEEELLNYSNSCFRVRVTSQFAGYPSSRFIVKSVGAAEIHFGFSAPLLSA